MKSKYTAKVTSAPATRWIYNPVSSTDNTSSHVHYFDLLTPTDQTTKCGRIVYTGIHVSSSSSGTDQDAVRMLVAARPVFPTECKVRPLNSQEKALEFMFFDLSGCVNPAEVQPTPPPPTGGTAPAPPPPPPPAPPPPPPPTPAPPVAAVSAAARSTPAAGRPSGTAGAAPGAATRTASGATSASRRRRHRRRRRRRRSQTYPSRSWLLRCFALGPLLAHSRERLARGEGAAITGRSPALQ